MMLPGAAPAVFRRALVQAVPLFVCSYFAVWTLVGLAVYALCRPHGSFAAGALTVAAGVYELTPLKRDCRRRCRGERRLGIRVRALLRRLEHRADARAAGARRDEPHLGCA
jgi:predicted metal-binding membrane protein